jgi:uncharacterized iron-regulated protein
MAARTRLAALALAALLSGCAAAPGSPPSLQTPWPDRLQTLLPADVLLLGEQHDAADHQRLQREAVLWLAERGQLAALVVEMAERGHSTAGLPRNASDARVQTALAWQESAWPWAAYGPVGMAAVAAGVPVLGGNLPRSQMRAAMADAAWDGHLPAAALARQYAALREGHCGLLPESQIGPMARIQIARDAAMAQTAREAMRPRQAVLLVAGSGHVLRSMGVPTHWSEDIKSKVVVAQAGKSQAAIDLLAKDADAVAETPALPPRDACAELRQRWQRPSPAR